jgi:hypothetical protein
MPGLFSYTIPVDDCAAPNPFRGMCSLAICNQSFGAQHRRTIGQQIWAHERGHEDAEDGELADLDAHFEGKQRYQQIRPGKLQLLLQYVGEPEPVD